MHDSFLRCMHRVAAQLPQLEVVAGCSERRGDASPNVGADEVPVVERKCLAVSWRKHLHEKLVVGGRLLGRDGTPCGPTWQEGVVHFQYPRSSDVT
eukprot:scaffold6253_cov148-Isochrysis_galbana.AAC.3